MERKQPGHEKTGRQVTFSTDLIHDVLRKHQPDHLLLRCARVDAASGLLDISRLAERLLAIQGSIRHVALTRPSPFAVPVLVQLGKERVGGGAADMILAAGAMDLSEASLVAEVTGAAT